MSTEGNEGLRVTGSVGRALEDAARVAFEFLRSRHGLFDSHGAHIHFPDFRTPKDGGSAGALLAAILYGVSARRRPERRIAITGEIDLDGRIGPVDGIREKLTAAHLHGCELAFLPTRNGADLLHVPAAARRSLQVIRVDSFEALLEGLGW